MSDGDSKKIPLAFLVAVNACYNTPESVRLLRNRLLANNGQLGERAVSPNAQDYDQLFRRLLEPDGKLGA